MGKFALDYDFDDDFNDSYEGGFDCGFDDYNVDDYDDDDYDDDDDDDDYKKLTGKKPRLKKFKDGELLKEKDLHRRRKKTSRRISKSDYDSFMDYE